MSTVLTKIDSWCHSTCVDLHHLVNDDSDVSKTIIINADLTPLGKSASLIVVEDGRFSTILDMRDRSQVSLLGADVIDAEDRTVLPGIDDSHLHAYSYGRSLTAHDFRGTVGLEEFQQRLKAARPEDNGWIRGVGWDDSSIAGTGPAGTISAADLDVAQSDIPSILGDVTGHQAVCNSAALRAAGVNAQTPDPSGGSFVRDEHGTPTGLVYEAAVGIINDAIPPLTMNEQRSAIISAQRSLLAQGITAFTDPGLGPGARTLMDGTGDLHAVRAYQHLDREGLLTSRVNLMLLFGGLGGTRAIDLEAGLDDWGGPVRGGPFSHLDIAQVKVFADGIPRSRTAWLSEPYDDCSCGHLQVAGESDEERVAELQAIVRVAAIRGWQIGAHSIGDRTITAYLDAIEQSAAWEGRRHYVIHGDLVDRGDLGRMAAMQMPLNTNPSIRWMVGRSVSPILGDERNVRRQPLRTALNEGVPLAFSSDAPVMDPDWRMIVASAMTRALRTDPDYTDGQRVDAREALQSITAAGAWQSHAETWRGAILPGMAADFIMLDRTADWREPWSLTSANVAATVVDGELVHGKYM